MPLDFPPTPALNEIYTFGGRSWQWNGTAWDVYNVVSGNVVTQLNGLTGGVTLAAGSNITLTPFGNTITIGSSGGGGISGPYVISFNGLTGAVAGVSSISGLTGALGLTNGSGIDLSISGQTMTFSNTGVLSFNGSTGIVGISAGSNINITKTGNTYTIASTASGAGGTYYNFTESISAPAGPTAGDRWFDTNNGKFFTAITDSGSNIWIESGGVGNGQAGFTTSIDFSGNINWVGFSVSGTGATLATSFQNFDKNIINSVIVACPSGTPGTITLENIESFYDLTLGWSLAIIAKPPYGFGGNSEEFIAFGTPTSVSINFARLNGTTGADTWYNTSSNLQLLHKEETYAIKGITGQSWVAADSFITCKVMGLTTADHTAEDAILEGVQFEINNINPGVGFDIIGHAPNGTYGKYTIKCIGQ